MKIFGLFMLAMVSTSALGQATGPSLDYGLGIRAEYQSNVTLDPTDEIDDLLLVPFVDFDLTRAGANVDATVTGLLEYVTFQEDAFDNEFRGAIDADVLWRISDQRFHWVFEENLARSQINVLDRNTPNNLQQINTLSTGPDVIFRLSGTDNVMLSARYRNFYADARDDDFSGVGGAISWNRQSSPSLQYGLRLERSGVSFDDPSFLNTDYDRDQLALNFNSARNLRGGRHEFSAEAGYMRISFDDATRDDADTPLLRLAYDVTRPDGLAYGISLTREIGDISSDLERTGRIPQLDNVLQTGQTGDPFERSRLDANFSRAWDRFSLGLTVSLDDQDFDAAALDQENLSAAINAEYRVRPLVSVFGGVVWMDQEFTQLGQEDEFLDASVGIRYQRTRRINYDLQIRYNDQDSTNLTQRSDNTSLVFRFTYRR
ncbi:MAG: hypothetical protein AB8B96_08510 [Lysobacterales bacterium]